MVIQKLTRPAFAHWRFERNLTNRAAAALLEEAGRRIGLADFTCSHETVRLICLPFGNPDRNVPGEQTLKAIVALTGGDIGEGDFYAEKAELA